MDQRLLAAPHGFSQRATSFIASWCQGIHRTPFSCSQLREYQTEVQYSHLAQEPSNLLAKVRPIPIRAPIELVRWVPPMPSHPRRLREQPSDRDGRAIKHIHSLHASEHLRLRGLGSLSRSSSGQTCNRRVQTRQTLIHMSKEQKTRPSYEDPVRTRTTIARPPHKRLRSMLIRSAFPPRRRLSYRSKAPYGGGRYRTDDPLLAKQVLSH